MGGGAWGKPPAPTNDEEDPNFPTAASPPQRGGSNPLYASQNSGIEAQGGPPSQQGPPPGGPPPSKSMFGRSGSGKAPSPALVSAKESELAKKAAELEAREKKLKQAEKELVTAGVLKKKNWPLCYPLLYHNIPDDIPEKSRRVVREMYICWWGLIACLLYNFFAASCMLGTKADQRVPSWFLAVIYTLIGIPMAFWWWYRNIYNAAKNDSNFGYIKFFFGFFCHLAFCVFATIAVPFSTNQWSFSGWMTAFQAMNINEFVGGVYFIGAALWTLLTVYTCWCFKDSYLYFRGAGGIQQAKQDAALKAFELSMKQQART